MSGGVPDAPAWAALLPSGTVWVPGRPWSRRHVPRPTSGRRDAVVAGPVSPWTVTRLARRGSDGRSSRGEQAFVCFPAPEHPVLVASRDRAVLRYLAESVVSVPPGTGPVKSLVLTAALRLLRFPVVWSAAALMRAAGIVLVGRSL